MTVTSKMITAQVLYDWQAVTGFISKQRLHEVFGILCIEKISEDSHQSDQESWGLGAEVRQMTPRGDWPIPLDDIREIFPHFIDVAQRQAASEEVFLALALACDQDLDFGVDSIKGAEDVEELRRLVKKICWI